MDNQITLDAQGRIALALGQALVAVEVLKEQLAALQKQVNDAAAKPAEGAPA